MVEPPLADPTGSAAAIAGLRITAVPDHVAVVTLHSARPEAARRGSTSHDGRYLWVQARPGIIAAGDVESLDNPTAQGMASLHGVGLEAFLRFWTLLEAIAKLESIPADVLRRRHGSAPDASVLAECYPAVRFITAEVDGTIITVAWMTADTQAT